jgi:hypothetical protein
VGGTNSSGRVEVYYAGVWGTVHNAGWDVNAARVLCTDLGYDGVSHVIKFAAGPFGKPSSGPTWLTNLKCRGNESNLWKCQHSSILRDSWGHDYDAGVECETNLSKCIYIYTYMEQFAYEWKTYSTDLQHVHGTTCRNIEMDSHCFRASHPITTYSYSYGQIHPRDSVPRGSSSGSEKRATEFYPWVPEDEYSTVQLQYDYEFDVFFPTHTKFNLL